MTTMKIFASLFFCLTLGAACQIIPVESDTASSNPIIIYSGESFGFCVGYCKAELTLTETKMVFTRSGWNEQETPAQRFELKMDPSTWKNILSLYEATTFSGLEEVYGCPDCADGGAEWIEIELDSVKQIVTYEYGKDVEAISAFSRALRELRQRVAQEVIPGN